VFCFFYLHCQIIQNQEQGVGGVEKWIYFEFWSKPEVLQKIGGNISEGPKGGEDWFLSPTPTSLGCSHLCWVNMEQAIAVSKR